MGHDNSRTLGTGDDIGHSIGFTRTGNPQQKLIVIAFFYTLDQLFNGLWLIASRLIISHQFKGLFITHSFNNFTADIDSIYYGGKTELLNPYPGFCLVK